MATADYRDPRDEFATALKAAGLVLADAPVMDGKLHRVPVEGARKGTSDGSYVGFADGKPSGYIENFKTGHKENWTADRQFTRQEQAEAAAQMQMARQQRAVELATQHRQTAEKVLVKWDGLPELPPAGQNAYLARKGVEAHGVKFDGDRLVVPVRDVNGKLWSVQSISPEEGAPKMFERGGRKGGNMHVIGQLKPGAEVLVVEGYATGASLHQATGKTVAVAFDSGNLDAAVGAIKQRFPTSPIYIMGDNDRDQQPNVGFDKAMAAAQKHQVGVAFPAFQEAGKLSDFNDLHAKEGLGAVKAQVNNATSQTMERSRELAAIETAVTPRLPVIERNVISALPEAVVTSPQSDLRSANPAALEEVKADAAKRDAGDQLTARDGVVGATHAAQLAGVGGPIKHTAVQVDGVVDAAKIPSGVAQDTEVRAIDAASAVASVSISDGVSGPAVQLGAPAVAGISMIDAGQRALNTAEAKLNEAADPTGVGERKAIERRYEEMLAVPRNGLDEKAAREVVKLDLASLHRIDNPRERHFAAGMMGDNAEDQSAYKAELSRQDPHTAEIVALAFAKDQQLVRAKEDRKSLDLDALNPIRVPLNSIEHVSSRQLQAEPSVARRSEPPLEERFNIVKSFLRGRDYEFRDQPGKVAFSERALSMTSTVDTPAVVKAMFDRAQERGWTEVRVKGSEEFQRQAWIAATARGIKAVGYEPTNGDRVAAVQEHTRLGKARGEPSVQSDRTVGREHQPAQDKSVSNQDIRVDRTSAVPATERPPQAATRSEHPNSRDAAIFQALESAFQIKNVPQELRADVRAQVRKELDVRLAIGQPAKVAIYDPAAPSREPQRTIQTPQRQRTEQERSR